MSKKHKHISAVKTTEQKAVQQSQQPQKLTPQKLKSAFGEKSVCTASGNGTAGSAGRLCLRKNAHG